MLVMMNPLYFLEVRLDNNWKLCLIIMNKTTEYKYNIKFNFSLSSCTSFYLILFGSKFTSFIVIVHFIFNDVRS